MRGISDDFLREHSLPSLDSWKSDYLADYGGSDRKDGLISPDGARYLIKYSEEHSRTTDMDTSYVNNVISEYLSSHILSIAGFDVHETFLATRNGDLLVACRNFTTESRRLIEFGRYMRKFYDSKDIGRIPDIAQIEYVLSSDSALKAHKEEFLNSYWQRFAGDAFVGNFDRHMGNWGYIITAEGEAEVSPVYDNGSTFFPALSEDGMAKVMSDDKEFLERVYLFPKAALKVNGEKVSYRDMLLSGYDSRVNDAVLKIVPQITESLPRINAFIDRQEFLTDTRKRFYKKVLSARMEHILKPAYEACLNGSFSLEAYGRIADGRAYTKADFEAEYEKIQ